MQVHHDIEQLPVFRNAVITIGTFDGVHMGHRKILDKMKAEAAAYGGETVIITFHPHPRKIVSSEFMGIRLITTIGERISLLEKVGIDHLVVVPFTDVFANQSAEEYIRDFLVAKFHPHTIIIGYDHRFGRDRAGNFRLLETHAATYGYRLVEIPKHVLENISVSSTSIRKAIIQNDTETVNKVLGYDFFFCGLVVHGNKLGRKLGYPTANLKVRDEDKIIPGNGIYAVYALPEGYTEPLKGMMSIGFRPTVDGKQRVIEVNIFDFDKEIYDQNLKVMVRKYLRPELKFDGLDALVKQIDQDKIDSLAVL
ncbi:MAG TPA: bifunctional riboflavin kinase/FAD synthetase [Chitinophagaceae bacterium]|nr:bifunctional riboflavin kinase/FAD synthetase [Chitinophagaceae bacterium]